MLTSETKRRIDSCRDILVGKLPLPTDQVELITLALIYKFMDDLDEESVEMGGKRSFFTQHLEPYRWRNLLPQTVSAEERMSLFARGIELLGGADMEIEVKEKGEVKKKRIIPAAHLPGLFRDVFRNAFLKFRDGRILTLFLTEVNGFVYSHSEELGNAFEYLLMSAGVQADNGQFRTPRHIIDFMVACLQPQPGERVLDPACGTAGFLVAAFTYILRTHTSPGSTIPGDLLTHAQREAVYSSFTGYDITDAMVKLSKVNLFLHGFPDPTVHIYDTLTNDARWDEKADVILANPPFMTPKGGISPHTRFRVSAKKSEVLFTDYIAEHLSSKGRGGVIVPNGIVATTQNAYVKLRRFLVEDCLVAVVSLPSGVFKPYSGVKTSILFFDKQLARKTQEVLFLKITADGFDLGDQRREIEANDLPEAERVVKAWLGGGTNDEFRMTNGGGIVWTTVEKKTLLEQRACSLQAEQFLSNGTVSEEIETVRLGDVCVKCQQVAPTSLGKPTFRYIDIDSVDNIGLRITEPKSIPVGEAPSRARKLVKARDVLFSTVRPYLKNIAIVPASLDGEIASTGFGVMRADEARMLPEYLFSVVSNQRFVDAANELTTGASYPAITENQLFDLEIPLPPLEEQRRIVAEIEGYQKVLDGARQILAGYKPSFDVDPEWETFPLAELIQEKPKNGYSGKPVAHPTQLKVLSLSATTSGKLDITKFKYLDEDIPLNAPCRCKRGDIYLQRGNTQELVGTAALFDVDATDFIYPDLMIRVRANEERIMTSYLLHTLQSQPVREFLMSNATGAAGNMPKINQGIVESIPIPLPPLEEQRRIVSELDAEAAQMEAVRTLIPRFEGKIQRVLDRVWGTTVA
ncbi:MAG: N-6 DNA methylase [Verrucomicrobiaceae bacterium]|nr:N-6 DNA methylase [Verrucomicrobiaceae bacterium]